jgi:hypothetical protein
MFLALFLAHGIGGIITSDMLVRNHDSILRLCQAKIGLLLLLLLLLSHILNPTYLTNTITTNIINACVQV